MMDFQEEKYWLLTINGVSWYRRLCHSLVRSGFMAAECQRVKEE